ncbi:hypothetical protein NQ176_g3042 [Zarea fungicola]|uniref:Uncharacterized protein n=1 Tax=Zarea fungicola TaxID=93591 RepID=A0ACC1NMN4_9HYPO|nr:hypothetical protein NQ176_g3042 [Lecanicillium fungicola]
MTALHISKPLRLPCGLEIQNRITKAALAERWADKHHLPSPDQVRAYGSWAEGGWGMLITGNVLVDVEHLGHFADTATNDRISENELLLSWKEWAKVGSRNGTHLIMQLNHPGRQSPIGAGTRGYFSKSIAPSAIGVDLGGSPASRVLGSIIFGTPREMTTEDIQHVIERFVSATRSAVEAGFSGVQIHAAHGYLLSQFLSPLSNVRADIYGGSAKNRVRIIVEILQAVRRVVPSGFCVGLKLNSVDHQSTSELSDCLEQLTEIDAAGIDFLEISGGTYEDPSMLLGNDKSVSEKSVKTALREGFFLEFARAIRQRFEHIPLMVTGGFRSRRAMEAALERNHCDMIGLGRPSIINSSLPKDVLINHNIRDEDACVSVTPVPVPWILRKTIGGSALVAGAETRCVDEAMTTQESVQ